LIAVTGVSGSGKSSLVFDLLLASGQQGRPVGCRSISGFERFDKIIPVEPTIGFFNSNSVVATYTGVFDFIRYMFADTDDARSARLSKNHFSYLNKQGQCPRCDGAGIVRTGMDFLPDVITVCELCKGTRYNETILRIQIHGKNIADILCLTVEEARVWFADQRKITDVLKILADIGLGYLTLGQAMNTLSGGEVQRLKLAIEMTSPSRGPSLYLFDEPSTGLHFRDVEQLMMVFHGLAEMGHTLIIIEHDQMVIANADHLIELGPVGGDLGGFLLNSLPS
jgi:excinuclease ABC subunit A